MFLVSYIGWFKCRNIHESFYFNVEIAIATNIIAEIPFKRYLKNLNCNWSFQFDNKSIVRDQNLFKEVYNVSKAIKSNSSWIYSRMKDVVSLTDIFWTVQYGM